MTASEIISAVAAKHGCYPRQLRRREPNSKRYAKPRAEAMATIRRELAWSFPRIALYFGGYNHTSVMSAVKGFNSRNKEHAGMEFATPKPNLKSVREEMWELRKRVEHLERIVAEAGLLENAVRKPPALENAA